MKNYTLIFLFAALAVVSCNKSNTGYEVPKVDPASTYDNRPVGASANDLLSAEKYKVINLEICYTPEHEVPFVVIDDAIEFLKKYCNKPNGIQVTTKEIPARGGELHENNLSSIERVNRTKYENDGPMSVDTVSIFVFVSEADYYDDNVLGVAYKNTSIAIFDGTISEISGGLAQPSRERVLSTVFRHELGHLLGLVNTGSEMQTPHKDAEHSKHCDNSSCLMYYSMRTKNVVTALLEGNHIPDFDENCMADLKANGGK